MSTLVQLIYESLQQINELERKKRTQTLEARELALHLYRDGLLSHHPCYWNDRFHLAMAFDLPEELKRESGLYCIGYNGITGNFEWVTHRGLNNASVMRKLGIIGRLEEWKLAAFSRRYMTLDIDMIRTGMERLGIDLKTLIDPRCVLGYAQGEMDLHGSVHSCEGLRMQKLFAAILHGKTEVAENGADNIIYCLDDIKPPHASYVSK